MQKLNLKKRSEENKNEEKYTHRICRVFVHHDNGRCIFKKV